VYDVTNGQPGLVGWFGELLTETVLLNSLEQIYRNGTPLKSLFL
jgi:hypothetical protein